MVDDGISEIIDEVTDKNVDETQGYLNDGSDVLVFEEVTDKNVKGLEHTDGDVILEAHENVGTSSNEGGGLTKQIIKNGEKKISARLQPQGMASKKVSKASNENRNNTEKQNGCHKETKILYLVWIIFIKYYFSYKVSKHGTRIKTDKTGANQDYRPANWRAGLYMVCLHTRKP